MDKWSKAAVTTFLALIFAIQAEAAQLVGPLVGHVKYLAPAWAENSTATIIMSTALERVIVIESIETETDSKLSHRALVMRFAWAEGFGGHIQVRFAKTNSRTNNITNVSAYTQTELGKPYAYVLYDTGAWPPSSKKLIATAKAVSDWDIAILDYVTTLDDPTDVDLEYLRQQSWSEYVAGGSWKTEVLGPVGYEDQEGSFDE